jgi:hypothetical protein
MRVADPLYAKAGSGANGDARGRLAAGVRRLRRDRGLAGAAVAAKDALQVAAVDVEVVALGLEVVPGVVEGEGYVAP